MSLLENYYDKDDNNERRERERKKNPDSKNTTKSVHMPHLLCIQNLAKHIPHASREIKF